MKRKNGFTLVELIVVVAILAILAAVAVPIFVNLMDQTRQGVAIAYASQIADAINLHNADESVAPIITAAWANEAEMISALGADYAPKFSDDEIMIKAFARVKFTGNVATVNTLIS